MVTPLNLTCSLHMHNLDAPRRSGSLRAVSLTDEFRVLIGCETMVYEAVGVNDIPIP